MKETGRECEYTVTLKRTLKGSGSPIESTMKIAVQAVSLAQAMRRAETANPGWKASKSE